MDAVNTDMNFGEDREPQRYNDHEMIVLIWERVQKIYSKVDAVNLEVKKNSQFRERMYFFIGFLVFLTPFILFFLNKFFN